MVELQDTNVAQANRCGAGAVARRIFRPLLRVGVLAYVGVLSVLVLLENRLIYPAPRYDRTRWDRSKQRSGAKDVTFRATDGELAHAWLIEHPHPRHFAVYCHENGVDVADCAAFAKELSDRFQMTVLLPEYRGYGPSQLGPSETGITCDAAGAMAWFCRQMEKSPKEIVVIGRSLGGGVAMSLAAESQTKATILLSTFSSLPDVAGSMYRLFPVRYVMRNRYPSELRMADCHQPLLQFHGDRDPMIPIRFAHKLFAASPSSIKKFVTLKDLGHNYMLPNLFWSEMTKFMATVD